MKRIKAFTFISKDLQEGAHEKSSVFNGVTDEKYQSYLTLGP